MSGHVFTVCGKDCDREFCPICQGGLALCSICHAYEGGLTTECPGKGYDTDAVYRGEMDFKNGQWVEGDGEMPCRNNEIQWEESDDRQRPDRQAEPLP